MARIDHGAADSALGYLYQSELALLELIRRGKQEPASRLALEVLDDVVFENEGSAKELLQAKHHLKSSGSISDASVDLWRSIKVWLDAMAGDIDADLLSFSLVTTTVATGGSAAQALGMDARRDVPAAQVSLERTANSSSNESNAAAYEAFLELSSGKRTEFLERVVVLDGAPTITDLPGLLTRELRFAVDADYLFALVVRLLGWWHRRVVSHLQNPDDRLLYEEVESEVLYIADSLRSDNLPIDVGIDDVEVDSLSDDDRLFVRQLQLISVNRPTIELAIRDYKRAYLQRSRWLEDQLVWPAELRAYEQRLIDEWQHQFAFAEPAETGGEVELAEAGLALYRVTQDQDLWIRPRCQERFVPRGSYHQLANEMKVGWHPRFVERLKAVLEELP